MKGLKEERLFVKGGDKRSAPQRIRKGGKKKKTRYRAGQAYYDPASSAPKMSNQPGGSGKKGLFWSMGSTQTGKKQGRTRNFVRPKEKKGPGPGAKVKGVPRGDHGRACPCLHATTERQKKQYSREMKLKNQSKAGRESKGGGVAHVQAGVTSKSFFNAAHQNHVKKHEEGGPPRRQQNQRNRRKLFPARKKET